MYGPWRSDRLIYRAIEDNDDDPLLIDITSDVDAIVNASTRLPLPPGKKRATAQREWLQTQLVGAVICLPDPEWTGDTGAKDLAKATPVGIIHLNAVSPDQAHHRYTEVGLRILKPHRGKGYGSEAIKWGLHFAFRYASLHRVDIAAFSWNTGAVRLYERLGFTLEGRKREAAFRDGKFWDLVELGMLEHEWESLYGKQANGRIEEDAPSPNGSISTPLPHFERDVD